MTSQAVDGSANTFKLYPIIIFTLQSLLGLLVTVNHKSPLFLYFTRSCHLPVSICLTISSNAVYRIHYRKNLQTYCRCSFTSFRVSHFKSDSAIFIGYICFKGIYKGMWGCIIMTHRSQMFTELGLLEKNAKQTLSMAVVCYARPIENMFNSETKHKKCIYYSASVKYATT